MFQDLCANNKVEGAPRNVCVTLANVRYKIASALGINVERLHGNVVGKKGTGAFVILRCYIEKQSGCISVNCSAVLHERDYVRTNYNEYLSI